MQTESPGADIGQQPGRVPATPEAQNGLRRVLIVTDDPAVRDLLAILATVKGCDVMLANHGANAEETIRSWEPALILVDISGSEESARERVLPYRQAGLPEMSVVVLGERLLTDAELAAIGAVTGLRKPFAVDELLRLLEDLASCF